MVHNTPRCGSVGWCSGVVEIKAILRVYLPFIEGLIVVSCLLTILLLLKVIGPVGDVDVVMKVRGILGAVVVFSATTILLLLLMMVFSCGLKMWNLIRNGNINFNFQLCLEQCLS